MESSSEDSFLWTDASSDTCEDIMTERKRHSTGKSESDHQQLQEKDTKRYQQQEPSYNEVQDNLQEVYIKKESNTEDCKRKRKIKSEPESDVDLPKKKRKIKHYDITCTQDDKQNDSYDNSYLDTKVKQEMFAVPSNLKQTKKDKRKRDSERQSNEENELSSSSMSHHSSEVVTGDQNQDIGDSGDSSYSKLKKKKKKTKKRYSSNNEDADIHDMIVEDKFTAEETVIGHQPKPAIGTFPNNKYNDTVKEDDTFQVDSDGSGDEISAIKGDENHDLHSTLFANRHLENETSRRKSKDSDNEKSANEKNDSKLSKYKPRTQNISDRIRFEEEDESSEVIDTDMCTDKSLSKISSKVNHHLKTNTHLKPLTQHLNISSIISKNDDIWLLKCPKDLDVSAFKNINLKIDGKYKIKISGQSYESIAKEEESGSTTVLSMENGQYRLKNFPLSGSINLKKRFPKPHFHDDNIMLNNETNFIPLPETKCRHPLFGSNYKKAMKIPSTIVERLNALNNVQFLSNNTFSHSEKKKKKKHKKDKSLRVDSESHTNGTEQSLKLECEPSIVIKEKKKKSKMVAEDESSAPKKKRIKHDPESAEAWESEKTIEENLFNF